MSVPRGYRGAIVAVGVGLCALSPGIFIAWAIWPGAIQLPDYNWYETYESAYQPNVGTCQPSEINKLKTPQERLIKRETCEERAEQHRIDTNDLKQQIRAADAAAGAVIIAEWQARVTVIGLIVGIYTLVAAGFAALFAKKAAKETERSANIAHQTLNASHRPWVVPNISLILPVSRKNAGLSFPIKIHAANTGIAVARRVIIRPFAFIFDPFSGDYNSRFIQLCNAVKTGFHPAKNSSFGDGSLHHVIPPNGQYSQIWNLVLKEQDIEKAKCSPGGEFTVKIFVGCWYEYQSGGRSIELESCICYFADWTPGKYLINLEIGSVADVSSITFNQLPNAIIS